VTPTTQIDQCDQQIHQLLSTWEKVIDIRAVPLPPVSRPRSTAPAEPAFDLRPLFYEITGVDLTQIPGIKLGTIQTLIAEVGTDMSKWPTEKHFVSWLGLCPAPDISGGKVLRHKTQKVQNRAARAFRMAANACRRNASSLGAFFRRLNARRGTAKALTATAHKLALIFYRMMRDKVDYKELGESYYEAQYKMRALRRLERQAAAHGLKLIPQESTSATA
jgi:hypothetical protein